MVTGQINAFERGTESLCSFLTLPLERQFLPNFAFRVEWICLICNYIDYNAVNFLWQCCKYHDAKLVQFNFIDFGKVSCDDFNGRLGWDNCLIL